MTSAAASRSSWRALRTITAAKVTLRAMSPNDQVTGHGARSRRRSASTARACSPRSSAGCATSSWPRTRSRRRSRSRSSAGRATARRETPAAWLYTVARNRAIDRLRHRRTAEQKLEQLGAPEESAGGAGPAAREARRGRRRAPVAAVHVLPSRARARGAGRADAAGGRRADRRGDRARVPRAGRHHVAAPGARQAQDPRRRDLVRPARRRGAARPPRRGAGGHLPDLQRGLRRHRGRGSGADRVVRRGAARWASCWRR